MLTNITWAQQIIGGSNYGEAYPCPNFWLTTTITLKDFAEVLCSHKERDNKDGFAFLPGALIPNKKDTAAFEYRANEMYRVGISKDMFTANLDRCDATVAFLSLLVLDYDKGYPYGDVTEKLNSLGLTYVIYSSFSNGRDTTAISLRKFARHVADNKWPDAHVGNGVTIANVSRYLREVQGYAPTLVARTEIITVEDKAFIIAHHDPITKFRVVIPLARPFPFPAIGEDKSPAREWLAAQKTWKANYIAFGNFIGVPFDETCSTLSRAYYYPSCPPEAPRFSRYVEGKHLDLDELKNELRPLIDRRNFERARQKRERPPANPMKFLGRNLRMTKPVVINGVVMKAGEPVIAREYSTRGLRIATILDERSHVEVLSRNPTKQTVSLVCPFADEHTQRPGKDTRGGCWAKDADDEKSFGVVRCSHEHCSHRLTEDFIDAWLETEELKIGDVL